MRKSVLLLVSLLFFSVTLFAQSRIVSGKVLMPSGEPAVGATVTFKGFNKGTSTGTDGSFNISVPASVKVMVISGIGIATQQIDVAGKTEIGSVTLSTNSKVLDEVVVVAYGQAKKTNITGSVATVGGGEIADKPFTSPDKALQGAVAGVQVSSTSGAPGSATNILIRGIGSISASTAPLWVIDGAIANSGDYSQNTTTSNILATLNPDDIESMTILKDAAATVLYGSKAANGVILVTTKHGKTGKTRITFSAESGQNTIAFRPSNKSSTTLQYRTLMREALINAGYATDNASADAIIVDPNNGFGIDPNYAAYNTNWLNEVTRTGNQSQYNLSISGGNEKTQVYASAGYFKQIGEVIASDYIRENGTLNIVHHANDWLTLYTNLSGGNSTQNTPLSGGAFDNPALAARFMLPWYTPYNPDGSLRYAQFDSLNEFPENSGPYNPLVTQKYNKNQYQQTSVRGNAAVEIKILPNVKFTSRYAAEYTNISEDQYWNPFYGDGYNYQGIGTSIYTRIFDYTWSNFADWHQRLDKGDDIYFDFKLGYEAYQFSQYSLTSAGQAFPQTLALQYLASAGTPLTASVIPSSKATTAIFSTGDINYKDRYVLTASLRRDGSSVFGANYPYGVFYAVGGTWNVSNEHFLQNSRTISLLKLRVSYGQTGNDNIGFYTALPTYGYGNNYNNEPGSAPNNVGNNNLTWEKNNILNAGLDAGFLNNRIVATVDVYNKKTASLLEPVPLSPTSGFTSVEENVGSLSNKGVEFTLDVKPVSTRQFVWDLNFNIAHNVNKVVALYGGKPIASGSRYELTVGHDAEEYFLRQYAGVNSANGTPQWYTDATKSTITGSYDSANQSLNLHGDPTVFGGLTNTFSWKGLSFSVQLYYNFGNHIYYEYGNYMNSDGLYLPVFNQDSHQLTSWQKPGDKTDVPQIIYGGNNNSNGSSTRFLYSGKYIRVRNIELDYALPKSILGKAKMDGLTLYVRGTNLFTFDTDKNIPFDPESGTASDTNFEEYIPKTIVGGIKIAF